MNSWDTSKEKVIYHRNENIKVYFDNIAPVLKCDITMNSGGVKTIEITDAFPLQKWTQIIVSADNQYVDAYIDGKLVKSSRIYDETSTEGIDTPKVPLSTSTSMQLGGGYDAYVS